MVFHSLPDSEKVYWLHYLLRMEARHNQQANRLTQGVSPTMHPQRVALLQEAHRFYAHFYGQIKEALLPLVSKEALLHPDVLSYNYDNISPFSIGYLGRDWGQGEDHEAQQAVSQLIAAELDQHGQAAETALFLGCGLGRYAVDFAPRYQRVEAFDASALMIWCIEQLRQVDTWDLLLKATRNCRRIEDTVLRQTVRMSLKQKALIEERIHFFVANAKQIPLPDQSMQHIFSIYFTDVLPLTELYEQLERLLLPEGLFIHFGPLEYFFDDERAMLTAEEIRLFFEAQGYTILTDRFLSSKHLVNTNSMRHRIYDNWFFIAQRPKASAQPTMHLQRVLSLMPNSQLSTKVLHEEGQTKGFHHQIRRNNTEYQLPEMVYQILLLLDARTPLVVILKTLDFEQLHPDDEAQLLTILQELLTKHLLQSH